MSIAAEDKPTMSYLKSRAVDKLREKYRPEAVLTLSQAAQQMADFAEDVAKENKA